MTSDLADLVRHHPLLADLPGDAVELVAGCAKNLVFSEGDLLLREGEAAGTLYLLRRGRVALETHVPGRDPLVVETLGPGDVVGWSWLLPPYRWQCDVRALEDVGAVAVDGTCLRNKATDDPAFGYALVMRFASVILNRLHAARLRLVDVYGRV